MPVDAGQLPQSIQIIVRDDGGYVGQIQIGTKAVSYTHLDVYKRQVLTRVIKDMIPRYRTMKGYQVPRKAGWDTHGLPVELDVYKRQEKYSGSFGFTEEEVFHALEENGLSDEKGTVRYWYDGFSFGKRVIRRINIVFLQFEIYLY